MFRSRVSSEVLLVRKKPQLRKGRSPSRPLLPMTTPPVRKRLFPAKRAEDARGRPRACTSPDVRCHFVTGRPRGRTSNEFNYSPSDPTRKDGARDTGYGRRVPARRVKWARYTGTGDCRRLRPGNEIRRVRRTGRGRKKNGSGQTINSFLHPRRTT